MNRQQHAARLYEALRKANPHLPEGQYVVSEFEVNLGTEKATTVSLQIFINLPDEWLPPAMEDRQAEFWIHAKELALAYPCQNCEAKVGDPCFDLRYTRVQPRPTTSWPHKVRFMPYIDAALLAEAEEKGWLNAF